MKKFKQGEKAVDRYVSSVEKDLLRSYNASLKKIRGDLAELYEKSNGSFAEAQKRNRLTKLEAQISDEIKALTGLTAKTLNKGVKGTYTQAREWTMFGIETDGKVQSTIRFAGMDAKAVEEAVKNPYDRIGFIQRNRDNQALLIRQVKDEIAQGLIQGKSFQATARDLRKRMEIGASKAITITRTETKRVRGQAQIDTMNEAAEAGVKMKKQWLATIDGTTRDSHQSLDGVTVELDEDFVSDTGATGQGPGQMNSPEDDINCRCTLLTIIEGFEPQQRRIRDEGIVDYTTFDKWKESRG